MDINALLQHKTKLENNLSALQFMLTRNHNIILVQVPNSRGLPIRDEDTYLYDNIQYFISQSIKDVTEELAAVTKKVDAVNELLNQP